MKGIGTPAVAVLRHQDMGARRPPRHLVPVETCGGEGNVLGLLGMTGKNLGPENDAENVWLPSDLVEERIELPSFTGRRLRWQISGLGSQRMHQTIRIRQALMLALSRNCAT
jgi:hypothetical protein